MCFCEVAHGAGDNAFYYLSQGVFQCDWSVRFGFHVVGLAWFSEYNSGCSFEGCWEVALVDAGLREVPYMVFNSTGSMLKDSVRDLIWAGGFVGRQLVDCLVYLSQRYRRGFLHLG